MTFLIIMLKGFVFVLCNMLTAFLVVYAVKMVLFKKKPFSFFGKKLPITQGFIVRKRNWVLNKLRFILNDYLTQAREADYPDGYIKRWEQMVYDAVLGKILDMQELSFLPHAWRQKIGNLVANAILGLVKQFLRKFVPFLVEKYQVHSYIDLLDRKLDVEVLISYFNRYVYKPILLFFLAVSFLIGLGNMILFWILV